jgi:hypothetical protein
VRTAADEHLAGDDRRRFVPRPDAVLHRLLVAVDARIGDRERAVRGRASQRRDRVRRVSSQRLTPSAVRFHSTSGSSRKSCSTPSATRSLFSERQSLPASTNASRSQVCHCSDGSRCIGRTMSGPGIGSRPMISPTERSGRFGGS